MDPRFYLTEDDGFECIVNKKYLFKFDDSSCLYCGSIDKSWSPIGRRYIAFPYSWYIHNDYIKKVIDYYEEMQDMPPTI